MESMTNVEIMRNRKVTKKFRSGWIWKAPEAPDFHSKAPNFHQIHGVPDPARSELTHFSPVRDLERVRFKFSG